MILDPELVARRFGPQLAADALRRIDAHDDPEMIEMATLAGELAAVALALDADVQRSGADARTAKHLAGMSARLERILRRMGPAARPSLLGLIRDKVAETSSAVLEAIPPAGNA